MDAETEKALKEIATTTHGSTAALLARISALESLVVFLASESGMDAKAVRAQLEAQGREANASYLLKVGDKNPKLADDLDVSRSLEWTRKKVEGGEA